MLGFSYLGKSHEYHPFKLLKILSHGVLPCKEEIGRVIEGRLVEYPLWLYKSRWFAVDEDRVGDSGYIKHHESDSIFH